MIPTIVVERRLKEEITVIQDGTTEIPQMIMITEKRNKDMVEGDIPPLHHHLLTERKSAEGHPHHHHRLRRGGRRGRGGTRRHPGVRGGEGVTRGRDARGSIVMITKRRSIGRIDIIGMTHRIRVQVLLQLKQRNSRGRKCPGPEVGPRKMTKNENIKKKE
jgi:hypothetical protein